MTADLALAERTSPAAPAWVPVPVAATAADVARPNAVAVRRPAQATLLCVDDEANITNSLKRLFRPHGYRILTAQSGAEGLLLFGSEPVDLVISDMRMPEMNGAQFLEQVRAKWPNTMRILLTGYADVESTIAAINKGEIHRYVSKPWDDHNMLVMVRQTLEKRYLEQENRRLEALTLRQNEQLQALNAGLEAQVEQRTGELRGARDALAGANNKLKTAFLTSIKVFSNLIELREGRGGGHSRRVADLARRLAVRLGMSGPEAQEVMLAALLHDIGKIGMGDVFFTKPANALSVEELAELKQHPVRGETALMALEQLRGVALLIRSHHERFDGFGYPHGLAGTAIPLGARVLALANDCDSLQHGSMTGKPVAPEEVQRFVQLASGKRYDPAVVAALFEDWGAPAVRPSARELPVRPADLKPGMVLTEDLLSTEGAMLLAADYVLDENLIRQIQSYSHANGQKLSLNVRLP